MGRHFGGKVAEKEDFWGDQVTGSADRYKELVGHLRELAFEKIMEVYRMENRTPCYTRSQAGSSNPFSQLQPSTR